MSRLVDASHDSKLAESARALLTPQSVVLVGASDKSRWSTSVHDNLVRHAYAGSLHLVNPRGAMAHGRLCATHCAAVGEQLDVGLIMVPLFANLDRRPYDAALTLGAPPWRAWLDTDFRELAPSFAAIWCLIAAVAMGTYGTALALAGTQINILPLLIYLKISDGSGDFPMAAALSLLLLGMCVLVLAAGELATRGRDRLQVTH